MLKENPEIASTTKLAARIGITKRGYKHKAAVIDSSIKYSEEVRLDRVGFCTKMLSDDGRLICSQFFL